ncbi:MAG: PLP-dependent aminotransferase family protein [Candidatus Promineifilaceae bacterium]
MRFPLTLETETAVPLYQQIYQQIRERILQGELGPGMRLPASRELARLYGLGRVTVTTAYEQLRAEGYVTSYTGGGTYVADDLPLGESAAANHSPPFIPNLSAWASRLDAAAVEREENQESRPLIDFGFGRSFPHLFPYTTWRHLLNRYLSTDDTMLSQYGSTAGFKPLRQAVAAYLARQRGVRCQPEQVVIVNGGQQALDILTRLLLNPGDEVLVETPGYPDAWDVFRVNNARLRPLPVDEHGFPPHQIPRDCGARLAFVTPTNQFPQGGAMPLERRLALLQWARENDALIVEDDYDGELRYHGHPLAALQGLDLTGHVVYLGTFSKVLFPALRLAYVVLPLGLLEPFLHTKAVIDRGAPTLTQAAVADFITEGHFEKHLNHLRKAYGRRREVLLQALQTEVQVPLRYAPEAAGLHVMLYLPPGMDEEELVGNAAAKGVGVYPGSAYHLLQPSPPSILLGFSGLSEEAIREGIVRLGQVLRLPV